VTNWREYTDAALKRFQWNGRAAECMNLVLTGNRKPRMGPGHQGKAGRKESVAGCSARDHAHDPTGDDQHVPIHRRSALLLLHV
jgi:hypothetical protein